MSKRSGNASLWISKLYLLILLLSMGYLNCKDATELVGRELAIWNRYQSNGYDNYDDEIRVNFKLESQSWFWYYEMGNRPKIYSNSKLNWWFEFPAELDSIYVHARFYHTRGLYPQIVAADTAIRLDTDRTLVFWNCGDTTVTEFPFPACWSTDTVPPRPGNQSGRNGAPAEPGPDRLDPRSLTGGAVLF